MEVKNCGNCGAVLYDWVKVCPVCEAEQEEYEEGKKRCARCGAVRTDTVKSNICGSCADELRAGQDAYSATPKTKSEGVSGDTG